MLDAGSLSILVNPEQIDAEVGPAFLTQCFGTRWTQTMYRWYLGRSFCGEPPDRLVLVNDARAVAACGVVYRRLRTADGQTHRVAIAVAAGTLPSARGRGYYARVLHAAVEQSATRGCVALFGFVTAGNTSGRELFRLGAFAVPSAYIVSRDRGPRAQAGMLRLREAKAADDWRARAAARVRLGTAQAGFHYPDASAWWSQMVDRPHGVHTVRVGASSRAVIESVGDTDRLQWLDGDERERRAAIRAVVARARSAGRKFFMYSTCPLEAAGARRLGLATHPGYMLVLPLLAGRASAVRQWATMSWRVQSGDRM